jgi:hypothetical protein
LDQAGAASRCYAAGAPGDRPAAALAESGIGPWGVWAIEPATSTVRGREARFSFRIALAQVGDANYELLAPDDGDSIYVEHLAANGEGFHRTCIPYQSREAIRDAKAELERHRRTMVQSGDLGDLGELCYYDIPQIGSLIELLYVTELPPPEKIID